MRNCNFWKSRTVKYGQFHMIQSNMFGLQKSRPGITVPPAHYSNSLTRFDTLMNSPKLNTLPRLGGISMENLYSGPASSLIPQIHVIN